jgi:nucleotide-binding universal stress UspA family protein
MFHTILVPLDGSAFSERALPLATALANAMLAHVILMRAASASVFPGVDPTAAQVQALDEAQAYLSAAAARLSAPGRCVEVAAPYGDAAESILMEVRLRGADLVVMCTHGRSGLGRWIFGSVAEKVLAGSIAPVLLVRPTGDATALESEPAGSSLLVPLDGSTFAEAALPPAAALARVLGSPIILLRAVTRLEGHYPASARVPLQHVMEQEHRAAENYLDGVAGRLRSEGLAVETAVRDGWPADVIAYRGAAFGPRLIVMASHGYSGAAEALLGSVALEVVRRSPVPVLLIRPPGLAKGDMDRG